MSPAVWDRRLIQPIELRVFAESNFSCAKEVRILLQIFAVLLIQIGISLFRGASIARLIFALAGWRAGFCGAKSAAEVHSQL